MVLGKAFCLVGLLLTTSGLRLTKNNTTDHAAKHNWTAEEKLQSVAASLKTIQGLQSMFTAPEAQPALAPSGMSAGGLTAELAKKDSMVWTTLSDMLSSTQKAMQETKGKSKADADKLMDQLENELNGKATTLKNISDKLTERDVIHSAEYVLGLLNEHKNWTVQEQLDVTHKYANGSLAVWELARVHDMSKPFAPQLAAIIAEQKKLAANATKRKGKNSTNGSKVASSIAEQKTSVARKAVKQFIELVASLRTMRV